MIDITIEEDSITVEGNKYYYRFSDRIEMIKLLINIIAKCKYSGETGKTVEDHKYRIGEWH